MPAEILYLSPVSLFCATACANCLSSCHCLPDADQHKHLLFTYKLKGGIILLSTHQENRIFQEGSGRSSQAHPCTKWLQEQCHLLPSLLETRISSKFNPFCLENTCILFSVYYKWIIMMQSLPGSIKFTFAIQYPYGSVNTALRL